MGHRGRIVVVTLFALTALASCTSSEQGNPTPGPGSLSTAPPPSSASSAPPTSSSSAPSQVDLSGVNACELFNPAVSGAAETKGTAQEVSVPRLPNASGCFQFNESKNVGLILAVSTDMDVNDFQSSMGTRPQSFTVAGFPGVVLAPPAPDSVCFGGVGMGDHQLLYLQYALANPGGSPKVPQQQLCSKLQPIAEQVVTELLQ